ncbi:MAG: hypothetical protein QNJ98_14335 [Planctomycetota bacterium]|nr:hypothetical protein [Planctomycetota bacterium]
MSTRTCTVIAAIVSAVLLAACGGSGGGDGGLSTAVLDQQNLLDGSIGGQSIGRFSNIDGSPDPTGASFDFQNCQSFTVGVPGLLREIRVPLFNFAGGMSNATQPVTLEVFRALPSGLPDLNQSLGSVSIPNSAIATSFAPGDPSLWAAADVTSLQITVQIGDQLAFVVRTVDSASYLYNPESTMTYAGGVGGRRNAAVTSTFGLNSGDYGFQTFVSP